MGRSNVPLVEQRTLATIAEHAATRVLGAASDVRVLGWEVTVRDLATLGFALAAAAAVGAALYAFFKTDLGAAMQAAGDNAQMIRALGVNVENMPALASGARLGPYEIVEPAGAGGMR